MENQFEHLLQNQGTSSNTGRFSIEELRSFYELSRRISQDALDDMQTFTVYGATQQAMARQQGTVLTPEQQQKLLRSIALSKRNPLPHSQHQESLFPTNQNLLSPATSDQPNSSGLDISEQLKSRLLQLETLYQDAAKMKTAVNESSALTGLSNTDRISIGEMLQWTFVATVVFSTLFFRQPILNFLFGENSQLVPSQPKTEVTE